MGTAPSIIIRASFTYRLTCLTRHFFCFLIIKPSITKYDVLVDTYPDEFGFLDGHNGKLSCYCNALQFAKDVTTEHNVLAEKMTNVTKIKLEDTKNPGVLAWYTDKLES